MSSAETGGVRACKVDYDNGTSADISKQRSVLLQFPKIKATVMSIWSVCKLKAVFFVQTSSTS